MEFVKFMGRAFLVGIGTILFVALKILPFAAGIALIVGGTILIHQSLGVWPLVILLGILFIIMAGCVKIAADEDERIVRGE